MGRRLTTERRLAETRDARQVLRVDAAGKVSVTAALKTRLKFEVGNSDIRIVE